MNIEIENRFNKIIIAGEYASIKEALEKNRGANLRGANLRGANLYGADLYGANLYGADLAEANLRGANLYGADLAEANLRGANLYGADLAEADLAEADLAEANLRGANLYGANLAESENINLPIITIIGSRHTFQFLNDTVKIGCHEYSVDYWLENYKTIGESENYSKEQIKEYGKYILMIKNLKEEEK